MFFQYMSHSVYFPEKNIQKCYSETRLFMKNSEIVAFFLQLDLKFIMKVVQNKFMKTL